MSWRVGVIVHSRHHLELAVRDLTRLLADLPPGTVLHVEYIDGGDGDGNHGDPSQGHLP